LGEGLVRAVGFYLPGFALAELDVDGVAGGFIGARRMIGADDAGEGAGGGDEEGFEGEG
jgi:hypothetical protein